MVTLPPHQKKILMVDTLFFVPLMLLVLLTGSLLHTELPVSARKSWWDYWKTKSYKVRTLFYNSFSASSNKEKSVSRYYITCVVKKKILVKVNANEIKNVHIWNSWQYLNLNFQFVNNYFQFIKLNFFKQVVSKMLSKKF